MFNTTTDLPASAGIFSSTLFTGVDNMAAIVYCRNHCGRKYRRAKEPTMTKNILLAALIIAFVAGLMYAGAGAVEHYRASMQTAGERA